VTFEQPVAILAISDAIQTGVRHRTIQKRAHTAATSVLLGTFAQGQEHVVHDLVCICILSEQPARAAKRMRRVRTVQLLEAGG
jgi:hypothetical protein